MKTLSLFTFATVLSSAAAFSWGQETLRGLLGGQPPATQNNNATPNSTPNNPGTTSGNNFGAALGSGIENMVRDRIQNAIQPGVPNGSNIPSNPMNPTMNPSIPQFGTTPGPGSHGLSLSTRNNGIFVGSLVQNSPASIAGLRANDQIVRVNGNSFSRAEDMQAYLAQFANSPVAITYLRNGQLSEVVLNGSSQPRTANAGSASIQSKLDQIERLIREIREELSALR